MEDRLNNKLEYLYVMLEKYNKLNIKTKGAYTWRERAIEDQIEALEELRDNKPNDNWDECYKEDLIESIK